MAVKAVIDSMKPGVSWVAMHRLATLTLLEHLKRAGVLQGDVEEMVAVNLGATFFPCGLGHFIGGDTHDVGGYLEVSYSDNVLHTVLTYISVSL